MRVLLLLNVLFTFALTDDRRVCVSSLLRMTVDWPSSTDGLQLVESRCGRR